MSRFACSRPDASARLLRRSSLGCRWLLLLALAFGATALAGAKTLRLDRRWKIEASDDWWYFQTDDDGALRTYTFGLESPEPPGQSLGVFLVTKQRQGVVPRVIHGFLIGLAHEALATLQLQDAHPYVRKSKGPLLKDGIRSDFEIHGHKFTTASFVFPASLLPGKPIPHAKDRPVMVVIGATSDDEIEQFIQLFEKIQAVPPPDEPSADSAK